MTTIRKLQNITAAVLTAICLLMCSCSHDDGDKLQRFASSECRMIARIDINRFLRRSDIQRNADGTVRIDGPVEDATHILPPDIRLQVRGIIDNPYITYDDAVLLLGNGDKDDTGVLIFSVSNAAKFISHQARNSGLKASGKDGWEYIALSDDCHLLARDHTALLLAGGDKNNPVRTVENLEKEAAASPLNKVFADGLRCKDRILSAYVPIKARYIPDGLTDDGTPRGDMAVLASTDIDGKTWNLRAELLDADGKPVPAVLSGQVDASLLRFAGKGHNMALLAGDCHKQLQLIARHTQDPHMLAITDGIQGPAMVSLRIDSALLELRAPDALSFAAAVACTPGNAAGILEHIRALTPADAAYTPGKSLSFTQKTTYRQPALNYWEDDTTRVAVTTVTFGVEGDLLTMTYNATPGKNSLSGHKGTPGNASLAILADLSAGLVLPSGVALPFGVESLLTITGNNAVVNVSVTDTDLGFAACMTRLGNMLTGETE